MAHGSVYLKRIPLIVSILLNILLGKFDLSMSRQLTLVSCRLLNLLNLALSNIMIFCQDVSRKEIFPNHQIKNSKKLNLMRTMRDAGIVGYRWFFDELFLPAILLLRSFSLVSIFGQIFSDRSVNHGI